MLHALAIVTATVVGTMVGVEFAVAVFVNPILLRLPAGPSLEARADGARVLGRVMPFWYVGSLLLTAGLAAATWGGPAAGAAITAAALLAVSVVMSVALLVPINSRSATWTADDHPGRLARAAAALGPPALRAGGNHRHRVRTDPRRRDRPLSLVAGRAAETGTDRTARTRERAARLVGLAARMSSQHSAGWRLRPGRGSAPQCRAGRSTLPRIVLLRPVFTTVRPLLRRYRPNRSRPM